jgi:hypothetical protein
LPALYSSSNRHHLKVSGARLQLLSRVKKPPNRCFITLSLVQSKNLSNSNITLRASFPSNVCMNRSLYTMNNISGFSDSYTNLGPKNESFPSTKRATTMVEKAYPQYWRCNKKPRYLTSNDFTSKPHYQFQKVPSICVPRSFGDDSRQHRHGCDIHTTLTNKSCHRLDPNPCTNASKPMAVRSKYATSDEIATANRGTNVPTNNNNSTSSSTNWVEVQIEFLRTIKKLNKSIQRTDQSRVMIRKLHPILHDAYFTSPRWYVSEHQRHCLTQSIQHDCLYRTVF